MTSLSLFTFLHWRRKWQTTSLFLPGESQGRGSLVGCHLWGCTESDMTEVTQQQQQQQYNLGIFGMDSDNTVQYLLQQLLCRVLISFFFITSVTNYHKFYDLKQCKFITLHFSLSEVRDFTGLLTRCCQDRIFFFLEGLAEHVFFPSFQELLTFLVYGSFPPKS